MNRCKTTLPTLICFNGLLRDEIPVPTILDNLLAADQIGPRSRHGRQRRSEVRSGDWIINAVIADYVADQTTAVIRKTWNVSTDPAQTRFAATAVEDWAPHTWLGSTRTVRNVLAQSGAFWRGNEGAARGRNGLTEQNKECAEGGFAIFHRRGAQETSRHRWAYFLLMRNRHLNEALTTRLPSALR